MIRDATHADIAAIVKHGKTFFDAAGWGDVAEYSEEDCGRSIAHLIDNDAGIVIVYEVDSEIVGMAGGIIAPLYFSLSHLSGQELFWWIKEGCRGAGLLLLQGLESAAREKGCKTWSMIALDRIAPERTGQLYRRRGYRASEHSYIKVL